MLKLLLFHHRFKTGPRSRGVQGNKRRNARTIARISVFSEKIGCRKS